MTLADCSEIRENIGQCVNFENKWYKISGNPGGIPGLVELTFEGSSDVKIERNFDFINES